MDSCLADQLSPRERVNPSMHLEWKMSSGPVLLLKITLD